MDWERIPPPTTFPAYLVAVLQDPRGQIPGHNRRREHELVVLLAHRQHVVGGRVDLRAGAKAEIIRNSRVGADYGRSTGQQRLPSSAIVPKLTPEVAAIGLEHFGKVPGQVDIARLGEKCLKLRHEGRLESAVNIGIPATNSKIGAIIHSTGRYIPTHVCTDVAHRSRTCRLISTYGQQNLKN